jgi:hypothetical protein
MTAAPVAAIQRSEGSAFIHSMSAKPARSGGANAIPHPSSAVSRSCHGRTMAPASGAKSAMVLMMANSTRTSASTSRTTRAEITTERCVRRRVVRRRRRAATS